MDEVRTIGLWASLAWNEDDGALLDEIGRSRRCRNKFSAEVAHPDQKRRRSVWYSGTGHTRINYGGNLHNTPENMMMMARAEDLDVIPVGIANKDNRVLDWQFLQLQTTLHARST